MKNLLLLLALCAAAVHGWFAWRYASPFPCDAAVARGLESVGLSPGSKLQGGIVGVKDKALATAAKHLHRLDADAAARVTGRVGQGLVACYRYALLGD